MQESPLQFARNLGCFSQGKIVKSYSISNKDYLIVQTGNSYKVLNLIDLKVKLISPVFEQKILFIEPYNEFTQIYFKQEIWKMHFSHCLEKFSLEREIKNVITVGKIALILTIDSQLLIFDTGDFVIMEQIQLYDNFDFIFHPQGYLNKVILYSEKNMILYNFNSCKEIFNFSNNQVFLNLFQDKKIIKIMDSPINDIVAIQTDDNCIYGINLKSLELLFTFPFQYEIEQFAFSLKTDDVPLLIVKLQNKPVYLYDLNKQQIHQQTNINNGSLNNMFTFYHNDEEYLFLISSEQNCIVQYIRDSQVNQVYRQIRIREGPRKSLQKIQLYKDRYLIAWQAENKGEFYWLSIYNDTASGKFSKKVKLQEKNNTELTWKTEDCLDFCVTSNWYSWEGEHNMFSIHQGSNLPIFWDVENLTIKNMLIQLIDKYQYKNNDQYKEAMDQFKHCTAINLSVCGFFLFVGFSNGIIIKLNTEKALMNKDFQFLLKDKKEIKNLFTDQSNHLLIVQTENALYQIDFLKGIQLKEKILDCNVKQIIFSWELNLIAIYYDERIDLINISNFDVVRKFQIAENTEFVYMQFEFEYQKLILSTECSKLIIYDIFLEQITCQFELPFKAVQFQVSNANKQIYILYENSKEVSVYQYFNLNYTKQEIMQLSIKNNITVWPKNLIQDYLLKTINEQQQNQLDQNSIDVLLLSEFNDIIKQNHQNIQLKETVQINDDFKWKEILNIEILQERNLLEDKNILKEQNEIPFVFSSSNLSALNKKIEEEKVITKRITSNEQKLLIQEQKGNYLELYFNKQEYQQLTNDVYLFLKQKSSREIDYLLKENSFDIQNTYWFLQLANHISQINKDFSLNQSLIQKILEYNLTNILTSQREEYQQILDEIKQNMQIKSSQTLQRFKKIDGVLQFLL